MTTNVDLFLLSFRPMFGRGAGGVGRTFDARQKIGMTDVRQRLGGGGGTGNQKPDLACRANSFSVVSNIQQNDFVGTQTIF